MLTVKIHPAAQEELAAAIAWYEQEWSGLGLEFVDEVDRAISKVKQRPDAWRVYGGIPEVHRLNVHRFPYSVIYRSRPSVVEIVAIAHQRRKPGYWRDRLSNSGRQQGRLT